MCMSLYSLIYIYLQRHSQFSFIKKTDFCYLNCVICFSSFFMWINDLKHSSLHFLHSVIWTKSVCILPLSLDPIFIYFFLFHAFFFQLISILTVMIYLHWLYLMSRFNARSWIQQNHLIIIEQCSSQNAYSQASILFKAKWNSQAFRNLNNLFFSIAILRIHFIAYIHFSCKCVKLF